MPRANSYTRIGRSRRRERSSASPRPVSAPTGRHVSSSRQVVEVALNRQTVVAIKAMTDEYGRVSGVPGLSVSIDGKTVGKTDAQGSYTYDYRGEPGKKAVIALAAPGYVPATRKTTVRLEGQLNLQHYFYPTAPRP